MTSLVLDESIRGQLAALRAETEAHVVDMPKLMEALLTPVGKAEHVEHMTRQTLLVPLAYLVTFSIESGHPCGSCRHMSMSVQREGRLPNTIGVWMVAQEFGFWGSLQECTVYMEERQGHGQAVNIIQPIEPLTEQAYAV